MHTLDKLLSDNINTKFFQGDVEFEHEDTRDDGKVVIRQKGSISLLAEWITGEFRTDDPTPIQDAVATLKRVRKMRQRPAHALDDNSFDQSFVHAQRELLNKAFDAVRTLRMVFELHPKARSIAVPDYLRYGRVWDR